MKVKYFVSTELKTIQMFTCAVSGLVKPRAMCPHIIVGAKACGYSGDCDHQRKQTFPQGEKP